MSRITFGHTFKSLWAASAESWPPESAPARLWQTTMPIGAHEVVAAFELPGSSLRTRATLASETALRGDRLRTPGAALGDLGVVLEPVPFKCLSNMPPGSSSATADRAVKVLHLAVFAATARHPGGRVVRSHGPPLRACLCKRSTVCRCLSSFGRCLSTLENCLFSVGQLASSWWEP